jgi:hypothetical protein
MDFIVSKVALSVCALMTAGVLYGVYGGDMMRDVDGDLERILARFVDETVRPSVDGVESRTVWEVPGLPDGNVVWLVVGGWTVEAHSGAAVAAIQLPEEMHTWSLTCGVMNSTVVEAFDDGSARIRACTGQHVTVISVEISLDNSEALMLFAEGGP